MITRFVHFLTAVSFHRGIALGAIVGAAIAGSTLWAKLGQARRGRRRDVPGGIDRPD